MNIFLQTLFGLDRSPGMASDGDARLELAGLPEGGGAAAFLLAAVAALALLWWLDRRERRALSPWRRGALLALRCLVLLAGSAMLVEPVLVTSHRETLRSRLLLVVDDSESMGFSDPYTDDSRASALAASLELRSKDGRSPSERLRETPRLELVKGALTPHLEALGRGRDVFVDQLATAIEARPGSADQSRSLDDIESGRPVSPLGDAIRGVLAAHRGQPIAGVVLASDGRSNTGEDPIRVAEGAARQGVPIFAVAAGADEGPRNIRVADIEGGPVVFVRDPMTLNVVVEARGLLDAEATLALEQRVNGAAWEPVAARPIILGEDGLLTRSSFQISPKVVGQYEFRASVEDAGPELSKDDNVAEIPVRVVRQQIRVLMIAGAPSPEVQFLRNALQRDQQVEFSAWYQNADPGFRQPGDRPIPRPPNDPEELRQYDALLLVDPDIRALGVRWPEMLNEFVGVDGGGLIFVAGELHSPQLFDESSPNAPGGDWTKILPVVRESGLYRSEAQIRLSSRNTYTLELTPEGRLDPIFAFHPDPIRNRAILGSLPGMYWSFPVTRGRPGATVLARHGDPRMQNQYGRNVLLATQLYGPGRTAFLAFDSTYRWRYLSEDNFDGFWARLIDRVGRNKALGGVFPFRVNLAKGTYAVGEAVELEVRYTDPSVAADPAGLAAELEVAGSPPEPIAFEKSSSEPGLLTARFPAEKAGAYTLRIVPSTVGQGERTRASVTNFRVEPPRREVDEPSLNRPMLAELARLTGGGVLELDELDRLDPMIPMREVSRTLETRDDLWDAPLLYATIVLGLTAEWVLRKASRLI